MSRYCFKAAELVWKAGLASDKYVEKHYNGREENLAALAVAETVPALIDQNQVLSQVGVLTDSVPSSEKTLATHDYDSTSTAFIACSESSPLGFVGGPCAKRLEDMQVVAQSAADDRREAAGPQRPSPTEIFRRTIVKD
jgi:hypothetical protein